ERGREQRPQQERAFLAAPERRVHVLPGHVARRVVVDVLVLELVVEEDPPQEHGAADERQPLHAERRARDLARALAAEQYCEPAETGGERADEREPARHLAP